MNLLPLDPAALLALGGLTLTALLMVWRVKGAILYVFSALFVLYYVFHPLMK